MGRKSNFYKEVDGAMAEWKQDLMAEAKALTLEDVEALAEQLREVNEHFRALQSEAEEATEQAQKAGRKAERAGELMEKKNENIDGRVFLYSVGCAFLGGLVGAFTIFLLLWYFW
ncbi:MAG TPA: hypothetical protein VK112_14235 [Fodinibius sp.]|nr:hypothetical protein [Fodinibius sp.]